jgi:D-glycero-D-manno-heptose 1,7-bisphosphate phosphatase
MGIGAVSRPAIFLDRDGVLVEEIYYPETGEWEAPLRPADVRLIPGAAAAARKLADAGHALVLISNQAAYAKGKTTLRSLHLVHEQFMALLGAEGATLDAVFYAYGHPNGVVRHFSGPSLDRKPSPHNLLVAAARLDLDLARSWMVGDRDTDIACATAAGVRAVRVINRHADRNGGGQGDHAVDLEAAARHILAGTEVSDALQSNAANGRG